MNEERLVIDDVVAFFSLSLSLFSYRTDLKKKRARDSSLSGEYSQHNNLTADRCVINDKRLERIARYTSLSIFSSLAVMGRNIYERGVCVRIVKRENNKNDPYSNVFYYLFLCNKIK